MSDAFRRRILAIRADGLAWQAEEIRSRDRFYVRFLFRKQSNCSSSGKTRGEEEVIKKLSGIWRPFFFIGVLHFPRCATIFRGDIVLWLLIRFPPLFSPGRFPLRRFSLVSFFISLSLLFRAIFLPSAICRPSFHRTDQAPLNSQASYLF